MNFERIFGSLRRNKKDGRYRPHKPTMLLAILDLAEAGHLRENRIEYAPPLIERYARYFDIVKEGDDQLNPHHPFFHLRSEGFWHLKPREGSAQLVQNLKTATASQMRDHLEYASLNPELFYLLQIPERRNRLRSQLINRYFPEKREQLLAEEYFEKQVSAYENDLERDAMLSPKLSLEHALVREVPPEDVRSMAFARLVKEAYDYRCAASGLRLILDDGSSIVELVPFAVSQNDDPRNGIALSRNHHWALDHNVLAPGPDLLLHVSSTLDPRIKDYEEILKLEGQRIILPKKERFWPSTDALEWRMSVCVLLTPSGGWRRFLVNWIRGPRKRSW
jgi:putative restriction endonuclease